MKYLNNLELSLPYERAKASLNTCLKRHGNEFLDTEISIPIDQILVKEDSVRVTFFGADKNEYLLETKLLLFSHDNTSLGYYCLHENENGEMIEDYLVFE